MQFINDKSALIMTKSASGLHQTWANKTRR